MACNSISTRHIRSAACYPHVNCKARTSVALHPMFNSRTVLHSDMQYLQHAKQRTAAHDFHGDSQTL